MSSAPKPVEVVPVAPPPVRVRREARFCAPGERPSRYTLPTGLSSSSPVGYRTRVPLTREEAAQAVALLAVGRPTAFGPPAPVSEGELFDECALGVLSARQSTNYRGHRQITLGPEDSASLVGRIPGLFPNAAMTHVVLSRPYRTPFTMLLTLVGHTAGLSLVTVPWRAYRKRVHHEDDIPTIGYLQHLHVGVLADAMDRAAILASGGRRRANVLLDPPQDDALAALVGLSAADRRVGWRIAIVAQVGAAVPGEAVEVPAARKIAANLMAFRSERIQPGVNAEEKAPEAYRARQEMEVAPELVEMAGRCAYNAFAHWTGSPREKSKELLLLERVDVLTPNGKQRLRDIRAQLEAVTDGVVRGFPWWADVPTNFSFSKNAERGRKAFALAGQRIYIVGLSRKEVLAAKLDWNLAVRAVGAAAARSALYAELMGVVDLPDDCDLLAGICLMAGPVNQNDIGKQFQGVPDLLAPAFADRDPTSLLVWTLKAKTVADPIGNEEQLMNEARKGALVDLRPGPHEVVAIRAAGRVSPMRPEGSTERAFADVGNFVTDPDGKEIDGNRGVTSTGRDAVLW
jgi:hypothetical protein